MPRQQLRYTLTIGVVVLVSVTTVYSQKQIHFVSVDQVTQDEGPSETRGERGKRDQLVVQMDEIDSAKTELNTFSTEDLKKQPLDPGPQKAINKLTDVATRLVEIMHPNVDAEEKMGLVTTVVNDVLEQCKCEKAAAINGKPAVCPRATQESIEAAMS